MKQFGWFVLLIFSIGGNTAFAQRDLKDIPDPDPQIELDSFVVAEGFEVNLFAADPLLAKPIQMNFDSQGRLWIASSEVYPQIRPGQEPTDKIIVVEDTDHDGVADKQTVFADGLLIPTGVLPGDGGCYAVNSTELIHLADENNDGIADSRRIVLSGFGTEDTHHLLHTLRWGPDGRINMNQSIYIHSHVETPYGVRHLNGGGIWQFRPETMELEILCRGFVNPWGHHFDEWGQSFATDGAYGEGINYVFPGSVFFTAPNAKRILAGLNPGSPKHCGLEILSGGHLPDDWQGNMIANDFRAHRVCRFVISEDGAGYASRQETELIKTQHVAFRPIDVKMGPDGAIYIADWYNPIIQHGEVDFRDPRRDHVHGRIWRVTAKNRPTLQPVNVPALATDELLELLKAKEEWLRLNAKLEMKMRGKQEVLPKLAKWLAALNPADTGFDHHRLEALWLYQNLDEVNEELLAALLHSKDGRVRAAAVRVCSQWSDRFSATIGALARAVRDQHPRVRLEAVCALAKIPNVNSAKLAVQVLDKPMDRFLDFALWQCMQDLQPIWLPAVQEGSLDFGGNVDYLTFALKAAESTDVVEPLLRLVKAKKVPANRLDHVLNLIGALGKPEQLNDIFQMAIDPKSADAGQRAALLAAMIESSAQRNTKPSADLLPLLKVLAEKDNRLVAAAARAAGQWRIAESQPKLIELASSENTERSIKLAAIHSLGLLQSFESLAVLNDISRTTTDDGLRTAALSSLAEINLEVAVETAVALIDVGAADFDPTGMIASLLSRRGTAAMLTKKLAGQTVHPDVARRAIRAVKSSPQPDAALLEQLRACGKLDASGWKLDAKLLDELVNAVNESGNPQRGQTVFRRDDLQCMNCHAIAGAGGQVGPDMVSIGASAPVDYLVESMIAPNAKVKENYHSKLIDTFDGKTYSGIPIRRNDQSVTLRLADGKEVDIKADDIEEEADGRSLMPDGSVDSLTKAELVDLVAFLSQLGKIGDFSVGKARLARRWQKLLWTEEGHRRLNRTSYDTAATDDPALLWQAHYSLVSGEMPVQDLPKFVVHQGQPQTAFVRTELDVSTAGQVGLKFGEIAGLTLWIDGKPMPIKREMPQELTSGRHVITLAIDLDQRAQPVRLELFDVELSAAQSQWVMGN